jgi:hypothetical protein
MPKVTLSYAEGLINSAALTRIGGMIRLIVADAASTADATLSFNDVDFLPRKNEPFDLVPYIGIEIETIGFPARKEKLGQLEIALKLRKDILAIPGFPEIPADMRLIWFKFWDPAGLHV